MRGWRFVGRIGGYVGYGDRVFEMNTSPVHVSDGDVLMFKASEDGDPRDGVARVETSSGRFVGVRRPLGMTVVGVCQHDFVYAATALGEDVFKRARGERCPPEFT